MDITKRLGCKRDREDYRDFRFMASAEKPPAFLPEVDLRKYAPPVQDQGELGSCVANSITSALRWHVIRSGGRDQPLSRLALYYYGREIEKTIDEDSGLEIRDGIKAAKEIGVPPEVLWPYVPSQFKKAPSAEARRVGKLWTALTYERVTTKRAWIKAALSTGFPVVFGVTLYESFENVKSDGLVKEPDPEKESEVGGHCMLLVGYRGGRFIVKNSWGPTWGDRGYCYVPESYVSSPYLGAGDYWIIKNLGE